MKEINIGRNLEKIRQARGVTRKKTAQDTNISISALRDLENNNAQVRELPKVIVILARYYRVSLNHVFGLKVNKNELLGTAREMESLCKEMIRKLGG